MQRAALPGPTTGIINDVKGEREAALAFYRSALEVESGQSQRHDQYQLVIDRAFVETRLKTPYRRKH